MDVLLSFVSVALSYVSVGGGEYLSFVSRICQQGMMDVLATAETVLI